MLSLSQTLLSGQQLQKQQLPTAHLVQHPVQLVSSLADTITIVAVNHKDEALCVLKVMPPKRANLGAGSANGQPVRTEVSWPAVSNPSGPYLVLTTHIPHCEANVLVLNSLHVES